MEQLVKAHSILYSKTIYFKNMPQLCSLNCSFIKEHTHYQHSLLSSHINFNIQYLLKLMVVANWHKNWILVNKKIMNKTWFLIMKVDCVLPENDHTPIHKRVDAWVFSPCCCVFKLLTINIASQLQLLLIDYFLIFSISQLRNFKCKITISSF